MALTLYRRKYNYIQRAGFLHFEAREFARQYTAKQIKTLPYIQRMLRWRRLYVANLRHRGYSDAKIIRMIKALYVKRGWKRGASLDPWQLLRRFRQASIDDNQYIPQKRKGSHHKNIGVSKGDVVAQKERRRKRLTELEKYEIGRGR